MEPFIWRIKTGTLILPIKVRPNSASSAISAINSSFLMVNLNASPTEGEANKALIFLLSSILKIPKSSIELISGFKSRDKVISIYPPNATNYFQFACELLERIRNELYH